MSTLRIPHPDRIDAFPRDTGCHVAPSCLHCPRATCIYDEEALADGRRERDAAIVRDYLSAPRYTEGVNRGRPNVRSVALRHGVSVRTVSRVVSGTGGSA